MLSEDGERTVVRDELPAELAAGWYRLQLRNGQEVTLVAAPARCRRRLPRGDGCCSCTRCGPRAPGASATCQTCGIGWPGLPPNTAPGRSCSIRCTRRDRRIRCSRRRIRRRAAWFANPLALSIVDLAAYHRADPDTRAEVDALRVAADTARIDYDLVWAAKRAALELLWRAEGRPCPVDESSENRALRDWATYCALAERHGGRWSSW